MTPSYGKEITSTKAQVEVIVYVYFSFVWFVYITVFFPGPTQNIFHTPMAQ